jgi:hypothetical protein
LVERGLFSFLDLRLVFGLLATAAWGNSDESSLGGTKAQCNGTRILLLNLGKLCTC